MSNYELYELTKDRNEWKSRAEAAEAKAKMEAGIADDTLAMADRLGLEIDRLQAEVARLRMAQPQVIPESGGHIESSDCWCGPTVEEHPGGTLIIHNQTH